MPNWLKQSTAVDIGMGPFLDETDGKTAETGLTITQPDIRLKKNGGAWAQKNAAQTLSHEENGWYGVALDTTDTNTLGILIVAIHESGALPVWREFLVVPANIYDSVVSGSDLIDVSTTQFNGSAVVQSGGRPEVNTTHWNGTAVTTPPAVNATQISGDATAADNLEAALDGTGGVTITAAVTGNITGNLSGSVGSVTGNVGGNVAGSVGSVTGAVGSVTGNVGGNVAGSVGSVASGGISRAAFAADTGLQTIRSNTAQAGAAGTITLDASASATDDFYNGALILLTGGTGVGQARFISDYVGATKVASVSPNWATNPAADSTFAILPWGRTDVAMWLGSAVNALISGRMDSNVQAMANAVITAAVFAANAIDANAVASDALGALELGADAAAEIADKILGRSIAGGADGGRMVKDALRLLRNKASIAAGTLTVTQEDDSTTAWTAAVGTTAGNPISSIDPA